MNSSTPATLENAMSRYSSSEENDSQPPSLIFSAAPSLHEEILPGSHIGVHNLEGYDRDDDSEGYDGDDEDTRGIRAYVKKKYVPGAQTKKKVWKDLERRKELGEMGERRSNSIDSMVKNGLARSQEPLNRASGDRAEQYLVKHDGVAVKAKKRRRDDQTPLKQMKEGHQDHSSIPDGRISEGSNGSETAQIAMEMGESDMASASSRQLVEYKPTSTPITIPPQAHFQWRVSRSILAHDYVEAARARLGWDKSKSRTDRIRRVGASSFGHKLEPKPTLRIMTEGLGAIKALYDRLEDLSSKRSKTEKEYTTDGWYGR
ncbi:hypothetical protein BOTCAL_0846g00030 [Botryotinia calthae]|uniref:Uncharacterized protein n=1 Tax=Botryotinia calthae TaxID=38488 RepID=A0A4Y8CH82_9HELO|nr:hypothetical protein BOTCAL_0846g00030 [Botryotinia calthae]